MRREEIKGECCQVSMLALAGVIPPARQAEFILTFAGLGAEQQHCSSEQRQGAGA